MLRILTILMTVAVLTLSGAPVLKTGQTTVYAEYDDGYYQAGAVRSYSRSGDVVKDNVTGLEWQDNETVQKRWSDAISYCSNGGWRLPSIEELETLVDDGRYNPSTTGGVFHHISSDGFSYWSSTAYADYNYSDHAWLVNFYYGSSHLDIETGVGYVRCVRGGLLETSSLNRDDEAEIVSDTATGLQWQDDTLVTRTWTLAIDYCENTLMLGGHDDWRLPNKKELLSIADRSRHNPAIDDTVFANTAYLYWSSTTHADYSNYAWLVDFNIGYSSFTNKPGSSYVRCVRGGQFDDSAPPLPAIIMYLLN